MKRKLISVMLVLATTLTFFGCGGLDVDQKFTLPPQDEDTSRETEARTEASTEPAEVEWSYELNIESSGEEYYSDDGVLLATTSYERPVLGLISDIDANGMEPPNEMRKICDAFNGKFDEIYPEAYSVPEICGQARQQYEEMGEESRQNFLSYTEEFTVIDSRIKGDLVEILISYYGYRGGVHGGASKLGYHFDLQDGEFFKLSDVTDDIDGLNKAISNEILTQIYDSGDYDYYFSTYSDTISNYKDYVFTLGDDSLTVFFGEYEIAPYAAGIIEFKIPYDIVSRYLNEDGERLIAPSLAAKVMGWFYEANEMWYWFEGSSIPYDYNDTKTAKTGDVDSIYYRVDVPGVNSIDSLKNRLLTRFSEDLADKRIASVQNGTDFPMYLEADGKLYVLPLGRGGDMSIRSIDYSVRLNAEANSGKVVATVTWQDYDEQAGEWVLTGETSDVEFPFDITKNGAVFTDFSTLW